MPVTMREFAGVTTICTLAAIGIVSAVFGGAGTGFVMSVGPQAAGRHAPARSLSSSIPVASAEFGATMGVSGLFVYGLGFGALVALNRYAGSRIACRATSKGAEVATTEKKQEISKLAYMENIPRAIVDPETLEWAKAMVPESQWANPPEDSYLYTLKMYGETYGPGKAMKMSWYDYYVMKWQRPSGDWIFDDKVGEGTSWRTQAQIEYTRDVYWRDNVFSGKVPLLLPGPPVGIGVFDAAIVYPTKAPPAPGAIDTAFTDQMGFDQQFSGEIRTAVTSSGAGRKYLEQVPYYRPGLKPWQRGIEIGMAHGYFLIGPFTAAGPLRATPEAATVGLLSGVSIVGLVTIGAWIQATCLKPDFMDKDATNPGPKGRGFTEFVTWHAVGGLGGAGFAHALITMFGAGVWGAGGGGALLGA